MSAVIRAELRKILSVRLWWVLLLVMMGAIALLAGSLALAFALGGESAQQELPLTGVDLALTVYTAGVSLGYVFPLAFGAILVTGEFRHRTLATSVLLEPRRHLLILGKLVAALPFALAYGVAAALAALAVGAPALALSDTGPLLDSPEVWRALGLSVAAMAVWMLVGVGFGTVVTSQVVVVVALLAWTQVAEPIVRIALGMASVTEPVARFLPGAAGEAIVGTSVYSAAGMSSLLPTWAGVLVLLGYGAVATAVGLATTMRRDIA